VRRSSLRAQSREFRMSDQYDSLLLDAYRGELFGDGFFGAIAEQFDGEQRQKAELLQQIEQRTAAVLRPLVEPSMLAALDESDARASGPALVEAQGHFDWDGFLRALHDALPAFLADFVRVRELAPDPDAPALVALVQHEQTINAFAELELAGHRDVSGALLERYLATAP
jgi:hypothetical protein